MHILTKELQPRNKFAICLQHIGLKPYYLITILHGQTVAMINEALYYLIRMPIIHTENNLPSPVQRRIKLSTAMATKTFQLDSINTARGTTTLLRVAGHSQIQVGRMRILYMQE